MAVLDDLSGFEFEDVIEDVFRNLGYENVRQADRTADEGRDVLMEEVVDGTRRAIIVECKHTGTVGRPVVQKLHSAIATFDFDGPKRGMVVTTGRFTNPAQEYANRLQQNDDPHAIELLDGEDLREIADEIGLDLYNGRIEILCDETLRPYDPAADVDAPVEEAFRDIENIEAADLPEPHSAVTFRPVVAVTADTNAVFETSVGVIHRINDRTRFVAHAERGQPQVVDETSRRWSPRTSMRRSISTPSSSEQCSTTSRRTGSARRRPSTKEWAVERLQQQHHDDGHLHRRQQRHVQQDLRAEPLGHLRPDDRAGVSPEVRHTTDLQEYTYPYEYYAAGPSRVTAEDGIHRCVHCDTSGVDEPYTYCPNCGAISCDSHSKTERLEQEPVCTGCAVTERFALKTKYFYDEQNLKAFREEYAAMPLHEKAMENRLLAGGSVVVALLAVIVLLAGGGII